MTAPTAIVQRYVKSVRHEQQVRATQELVWEPGSAQVDFGEADFNVNGLCRRMKYLTVSFLYSNDGFTQVFGGETAECVCQGLRNIFEYIGGVPPLFSREDAKSWRAANSSGSTRTSSSTAQSAPARRIWPLLLARKPARWA